MSEPVLYILMRSDMTSLNPGKAMAQAAHAANQFQVNAQETVIKRIKKMFAVWKKQGDGFGTTIVLDVKTEAWLLDFFNSVDCFGGPVIDETYPILDGEVLHTFPCVTCGWVFADRRDTADILTLEKLSYFNLYK